MMAAPSVRFDGVVKRYGALAAVESVTLDVMEGESFALLGHNGAGKTTLFKLALGLTRPDSGAITTLGVEPGGRSSAAARHAIGFLPENVAFSGAMTGAELLRFFGRLKGIGRAACDAALERVGLADAAHKRVKTYSKGMRQRLGLAQAILGTPRLLFLDEPTSGLDPGLRRDFYLAVRDMAQLGVTVLLSSHALTEIEARTDRVGIMRDGRLVACGTLDELRRSAGLPTKIRVSVRPGGATGIAAAVGDRPVRRINDHAVELTCAASEKLDLVGRILASETAVEDVELFPPSLEALYDHFRDEGSRR